MEGSEQEQTEDGGETEEQHEPDSAAVVVSLNHWLRRAVLRRINFDGVLFSASHLEEVMDIPLNNLSYHLRAMEKTGVLKEVDEIQRRGAFEHIFTSEVVGNPFVATVLAETEADDRKAEQRWREKRAAKQRKAEEAKEASE